MPETPEAIAYAEQVRAVTVALLTRDPRPDKSVWWNAEMMARAAIDALRKYGVSAGGADADA